MALSAQEVITRLKESEERTHVLVNDPANVGYYTTDTTPTEQVETYPHFMRRITDTTDGIVAQANAAVEKAETIVNDGLVQIDTLVNDGLVQINESVSLAHKWATNPEDVPVKPGEFSAYHWAKKAQQVLSAAGYIDYTIGAYDPLGFVRIMYSAIGHPAMDRVINPIVNILARTGYTHTIAARSRYGFDIIIYRPDGTPGVEVGEFIDCGSFTCGDGTQCGQQGAPVVSLAVSIPVPLIDPPVPPVPDPPPYVDCGTFQCGDGTECGQPGADFQ